MLCLLPSVEELTSILLKCSKGRNLAHALRMQAYLGDLGLEAHASLGNCLVFVLVQVESICHAEQVFDRLLLRDKRSWNSLIIGHAKYGDPQHALALYQLMLENDSLDPSAYSFIALLKVCSALNDLERGQELHIEIARRNLLEQNVFIGSSLVNMYAKCSALEMAQDVFDKLAVRDVYLWNALIGVYVEHGQCEDALMFFEQMQLDSTSPDAATFVCCLKACSSIRALSKGFELHSEIARKGFLEGNVFVGSALVDMYSKFGALAESQYVFDNLPSQDTFSWTALMMGYVKHGHGERALSCFEKMQHQGVASSAVTFVCCLRACVSIGAFGKGQELHAEIARSGLLEKDVHIGSTLVDMYAKCGFLVKAQGVFYELQSRNEILWNTLIAGYAEQGLGEEAFWNYEQMQLEGFSPDHVTYICCLKSCSSLGDGEKGLEIHAEIVKKGLESDLVVGSTLVDMYAKSNSCASAREVFDMLPARNVVVWNALIAGLAEQGQGEESLNCYEQMQLDGIVPDAVTFVSCSKVCGSLVAMQKGQVFHAEVCRKGLEMDLVVGSTLVDMYAKFGWLSEGQKVFDKLLIRNEVSWNALIAGYSDYGHADEALNCFEQMQHEGASPDAFSLACSLKACSSIGTRKKGQEIHIEITKKGLLERDIFVCSALIDMYAQCGSLAEAQTVIVKLPVQNVVSWNALITGFVEQGHGEEVLNCYKQMQHKAIPPDAVTLVCVLKACGIIGASDMGQKIHIDIAQKGLERDVQLGSTLVDMYGKSSSLAKAEEAFDKLPVRNVVSWNVLIANYLEHGCYDQALYCFEKMKYEGISWDATTIVCGLKACASIEAADKARGLHAEILKKGLEKAPLVGNTLIDVYAKFGLLTEAQDMFCNLPVADGVSWNALTAGFVEQGQAEEAFNLREQMQIAGACPDAITFVFFLKACGCKQTIGRGREVHAEIVKKGFLELDVFVGTALVDMYIDCGLLVDAREAFDKLPLRNLASWNALLAGYVEYGDNEEALNLFEQMQCEGVASDSVTVACIVKACGTIGNPVKGREIHSFIAKKGLESEPVAGNALVDMYDKCDSITEARKMFDRLPVRDKVSWTTLIAGYTGHGNGEAALNCYKQMQEEGVPGSSITFACCLKACGSSGASMKGQELHAEIAKKGLESEPHIGNTLVDMYSKCGLLAAMQEIFDKLAVRDVISWNALIAGYAQLGESETAFSIFNQMSEESINPDSVTFTSILNACSNVGLVDKGGWYFEGIRAEYGRIPTLENYTCMVDLLGRAGNLYMAISFIERMPFQPGILVWHILLGACRKWGDVDLGHHAFEQAVRLDSNAAAAYICMSNIYAGASLQENVNTVEVMQVEKSVRGF